MIEREQMHTGMRVRHIGSNWPLMIIVDLPIVQQSAQQHICSCKWFNAVTGTFAKDTFWNWELEAAE